MNNPQIARNMLQQKPLSPSIRNALERKGDINAVLHGGEAVIPAGVLAANPSLTGQIQKAFQNTSDMVGKDINFYDYVASHNNPRRVFDVETDTQAPSDTSSNATTAILNDILRRQRNPASVEQTLAGILGNRSQGGILPGLAGHLRRAGESLSTMPGGNIARHKTVFDIQKEEDAARFQVQKALFEKELQRQQLDRQLKADQATKEHRAAQLEAGRRDYELQSDKFINTRIKDIITASMDVYKNNEKFAQFQTAVLSDPAIQSALAAARENKEGALDALGPLISERAAKWKMKANPTEPKQPKSQIYWNPDTGKRDVVLLTAPGATEQIQKLISENYIPITPPGGSSTLNEAQNTLGTSTKNKIDEGLIELTIFGKTLAQTRRQARRVDDKNFGITGNFIRLVQDAGYQYKLLLSEAASSIDADGKRLGANSPIYKDLVKAQYDPNLRATERMAIFLTYQAAAAIAKQEGRALSDTDYKLMQRAIGDPTAWYSNKQNYLHSLINLEISMYNRMNAYRSAMNLDPVVPDFSSYETFGELETWYDLRGSDMVGEEKKAFLKRVEELKARDLPAAKDLETPVDVFY